MLMTVMTEVKEKTFTIYNSIKKKKKKIKFNTFNKKMQHYPTIFTAHLFGGPMMEKNVKLWVSK